MTQVRAMFWSFDLPAMPFFYFGEKSPDTIFLTTICLVPLIMHGRRVFEFRYCFGLPWRDVSRIKRARYGISQLFSICVWPEIQVWARDFGIRISGLNVTIILGINHFIVDFDVTLG